jgi:hypothetical protein
MTRLRIIGNETEYIGPNPLLLGQSAHVVGIIRGSVRDRTRRSPEVTDNEELYARPVAPEDGVRVRIGGVLPKVVRATELACFRHLAGPPLVRVEVRLERAVLHEANVAAQISRRSLDAVLDEALTKHLRSIGFLRSQSGEVHTGGDERQPGGRV